MFAFTDRMRELTNPKSFIDFDLKGIDILPRNLKEFYEFNGSLTTPPYSEITTWIVYPETMYISSKQVQNGKQNTMKIFLTLKYYINILFNISFQLQQFRTILNDKNAKILANSRELQSLGDRTVYHVMLFIE